MLQALLPVSMFDGHPGSRRLLNKQPVLAILSMLYFRAGHRSQLHCCCAFSLQDAGAHLVDILEKLTLELLPMYLTGDPRLKIEHEGVDLAHLAISNNGNSVSILSSLLGTDSYPPPIGSGRQGPS